MWEERRKGREILHAGRSREYRLISLVNCFLPVDNSKGVVYYFHGHYWLECLRYNIDKRMYILKDNTL